MGSADPGSAAGGSAGTPGAGSAAGSGAASGSARIIQLPTDINAPAVNAAATPTVVRIGGKFTVVITATFGEGVEVNLREPIELGSIFEVTRKVSQDSPAGDGRRTREWQLEVIAWDLGDLVIPPIPITYTAFGHMGEVPTNAIRLKVTGVLGELIDDPKAMRPDAAPQILIARDWFWAFVGGGALAALIVLIAAIWIVRKRRKKTIRLVGGFTVRPRKIDMTSERALERLLAIEQSGVLDRDEDRKQGYSEMVEVIREYLGARYRVATLDLTSSEVVKALAKVAPPPELGLVEKWLDACDIVKYGGLRASASAAKQTLEDARSLVITTTQLAAAARSAAVSERSASERSERSERSASERSVASEPSSASESSNTSELSDVNGSSERALDPEDSTEPVAREPMSDLPPEEAATVPFDKSEPELEHAASEPAASPSGTTKWGATATASTPSKPASTLSKPASAAASTPSKPASAPSKPTSAPLKLSSAAAPKREEPGAGSTLPFGKIDVGDIPGGARRTPAPDDDDEGAI